MSVNQQQFLYLLIGLPASGKSTYCNEKLKDCTILSSDNIREDLFGTNYSNEIEKEVFQTLIDKIIINIKNNENIVLDTTYFNTIENRKILLDKINGMSNDINTIAIYFNTNIKDCINRNKQRQKHRIVDDNIIYKLHSKLNKPRENENFTDIVIVK